MSTLIDAIFHDSYDLVHRLLDDNYDMEDDSEYGWGALSASVRCNNTEIVKLLLQRGANSNAIDYHGIPVFITASQFQSTESMNLLLDNSDIIDVVTESNSSYDTVYGKTALMTIIASPTLSNDARFEVFKLLIGRGANIDIVASDGSTALSIAKENGHCNIVKLLEIELAKRSSVGCNTKSARKRQNSS